MIYCTKKDCVEEAVILVEGTSLCLEHFVEMFRVSTTLDVKLL